MRMIEHVPAPQDYARLPEVFFAELMDTGNDPISIFCDTLEDESASLSQRRDAARRLKPYFHRRLAAVGALMSRMAANRTVGRANVMRQSMLALIETGKPQEAYPEYWAPFVVVGEGS